MRKRLVVMLALVAVVGACGGDGGLSASTTAAPHPSTTAPGAAPLWTRLAVDEAVFGGPGGQVVRGVARGDAGVVAVGYDDSGGELDAAVWVSPDGATWTRIPHDEEIFGGAGSQVMWAVAAGGPGLVAVGSDDSGGDQDAAVWTSSDGASWTRVAHDEIALGGPSWQEMYAVVGTGGGLVAVGASDVAGGADAAVWTSTDGLTWTRVPLNLSALGGLSDQVMTGVVATDGGLVAVGVDWSGGDQDAAVWTSRDERTWTRSEHDETVLGGDDNQGMSAVVATDTEFVAVGSDGSANDADAAVWTSPDGATWTRVTPDTAVFGGSSRQEMLGVAVTADGLVAVGFDDAGGDADAAVWTTPDGGSWMRVTHDEEVFGGPNNQGMGGVIVMPAGLVAVGLDDSGGDGDMTVWTSPIG